MKSHKRQLHLFRAVLSILITMSYIALVAAMIYVDASDTLNMSVGENSYMDILKMLIGVLTAIQLQIVNFWFNPLHPKPDHVGEDQSENDGTNG